MIRVYFILLFSITLSINITSAQTRFAFITGYNSSFYTKPLHHISILYHDFNSRNSNYDKFLSHSWLNHGIILGCRIEESEDDNGGFVLFWSNKHAKTTAEGFNLTDSADWKHKVKHRFNVLSMGLYFHPNKKNAMLKNMEFGGSVDFGNFKVFKKQGPADSFKDSSYVKVYDKNAFTMGISLWATCRINSFLLLKGTCQTAFPLYTLRMKTEMDIDYKYFYRFHNITIALIARLGSSF